MVAHAAKASGLSIMSNKHVWILGILGFSAGLPLLLIFSSLSIWLTEAGISKSSVTVFSWAALAYSFKFIWAPIIDRVQLPLLCRLGHRRAWLLLSQSMVIVAILAMALTNPAQSHHLSWMAFAAVLLGFSSATQDIVIDAYRIESAPKAMQGLLSASYTAGYRLAMIVSGAGTLYLAAFFGSDTMAYRYEAWRNAYFCIALFMLLGVITTLCVSEPSQRFAKELDANNSRQYGRIFIAFVLTILSFIAVYQLTSMLFESHSDLFNMPLLAFTFTAARLCLGLAAGLAMAKFLIAIGLIPAAFFYQGYIAPVSDFFTTHGRYLAIVMLLIIGFYRSSDIVLGVIANLFYIDMGFNKQQIATAVKAFGPVMTILGGFIGGICVLRLGVLRLLFWSAILVMLTNLCFISLIYFPSDISLLYAVIALDNLAGGLATTAFIAFLSGLVNLRFTAMQYSIFSSLMSLFPKLLGGYSGAIVESLGYSQFFMLSASLCLPVLLLIYFARKHLILLNN